jgi:hypothetical protein
MTWRWNKSDDIKITYDVSNPYAYVTGRCSRWDVSDYSVVIETWINKSGSETLKENVMPGAIGEFKAILGKPKYYDKTWTGGNTLLIHPIPSSNSQLFKSRGRDSIIYVKSISDSPIRGDNGWINVKIEGNISGSREL